MPFRNLSVHELPREKALRYGISSLSNNELLTIIIGSGVKNHNAMDIAYDLLKEDGLLGLKKKSVSELSTIEGVSKITAIKLLAALELASRMEELNKLEVLPEINSQYIFERYRMVARDLKQETFGLIILDKRGNLLKEKQIYQGTSGRLVTSNKEIFKEVLIEGGTRFYVYHTHPEGKALPSDYDIVFTSKLIKEARKFDLVVVDHVIVCPNEYFSFKKTKI